MTSPDGVVWSTRTSAANNDWRGVCYSPELNRFVAVARSGTGRAMTLQADQAAFVDMLAVGGSSAPAARLDVTPAAGGQRALRVGTSLGADALVIDANGSVSVATSSTAAPAAARLDVAAAYQHPPFGNAAGYIASASASDGANTPDMAIDGLAGTLWSTAQSGYNTSTGAYSRATPAVTTFSGGSTVNGDWWQLQLPSSRAVSGFTITGTTIKGFVVAGSGTGADGTWVSVFTRNAADNVSTTHTQATTVTFSNTSAYAYYRLIITNHAHTTTVVHVAEFRFLEAPPNSRALRVGTASGGDGLVVDWNGNVGVGRSGATSRLHVGGGVGLVHGDAGAGSTFLTNQITMGFSGNDEQRHAIRTRHKHDLNNTQNAIDFYIWQTTDGSNAGTKQMLSVTSAGVGIGTMAPAAQLDLSTDNARKLTSSAWSTGSDSRVKVNIEDADYSVCYSNVKNIPLRRFEWDSNMYPDVPDRHAVGWIAQEVEAVFPKAVTTTAEHALEDFRTLNVDQLYKTMWGALRRCMDIIESQDARIAALEGVPQ
jgi:hypothetical protein